MNGIVPWKSDLAKLLSHKLNEVFFFAKAKPVDDHIEFTIEGITYNLTITKKR